MTTTSEWVTPADLAECVDTTDTDLDLDFICDVAAQAINALSGNQFGIRRSTVRPTRLVEQYCGGILSYDSRGYLRTGGDSDRYALELRGPITTVHAVKVDGVVLGATEYRASDRHVLHRVNPTTKGRVAWPTEQWLHLADSEVGTFSIDYSWGVAVPAGAKNSARIFACQAAKGAGGGECDLPPSVVSVVRLGLSFDLSDIGTVFDAGRTGINDIDQWLSQVNPQGLRRRPSITSPDSIMLNPT